VGTCDFIYSADGAKVCLADLEFPASKDNILNCIEANSGPEAVIVYANRIPEKVYGSMDEVVELLEARD
jgi:hypothetical protein